MNKKINDERLNAFFGKNLGEFGEIHKTIGKINSAYNGLKARGETRIINKMPITAAFTVAKTAFNGPQTGNFAQDYLCYAIRPDEKTVLTNNPIVGAGDAHDGYGRRYEIKYATVDAQGHISINGIRPENKVDNLVLLVNDNGYFHLHVVPWANLKRLPLTENRNGGLRFVMNYSTTALSYVNLVNASTITRQVTDQETGMEWNPFEFLDMAGVTREEIEGIAQLRDEISASGRGHDELRHLTSDELAAIHPLVSSSKFGLLMQDRILHYLGISTARKPRKGDGRGRKDVNVEVKYSAFGQNKTFRFDGIRPSESKEFYFAAFKDGTFEFFNLVQHQAQYFCDKYGTKTARGIYSVQTNSKAMRYLRRNQVALDF